MLCTVRECGLSLRREGNRYVCASGHSFDIARSGYVNLLQPQDRRSKDPGDSREVVAARRRLHDRGVTRPLFDAIASALMPGPNDIVFDAGCGEGFYLGNLAREHGVKGCGVDISIPAVDAAARRYPDVQWLVANADRQVPWEDASFSAVISITGRMHPAEFRRVLRDSGRLLIAVPAPDDFREIRGAGRDRTERTIDDFAPLFRLESKTNATTAAELDADGMNDVLLSIYRPMHSTGPAPGRVTLSLDLLLFRPT